MRSVIFIAVAVLLSACAQRQSIRVKTTRALTAEEFRIIGVARQALSTNDALWVHRAEFELPRRRPEGGSGVTVWRLPATPGGFRVIEIDDNDRVVGYSNGY